METGVAICDRTIRLGRPSLLSTRHQQHATRRFCNPTSRAASGTRSTELNLRPDRPAGCHHSTPRTVTPAAVTVEISLISAVRTHALCVHTQDHLGGRHRRADRRGTAAHRPHLVARTLHTHAYAGLIRPREKAPRNPDLRHHPERETAGHSVVHTQEGATNPTNWWRGQDLNLRPSGYEPDELPDCSTPRRASEDTSTEPVPSTRSQRPLRSPAEALSGPQSHQGEVQLVGEDYVDPPRCQLAHPRRIVDRPGTHPEA